jgi:bifunctional DNA-binding transcriptional regulator/antitoxin component of YhaV-PrlF toxin-antitoxin module
MESFRLDGAPGQPIRTDSALNWCHPSTDGGPAVRTRGILSHMTIISVTAEARMRARNQMTLPDPVVQAAGIVEGDRFVVEVTPGDPDTVRLHRIRPSYAGALADVFGDSPDYLDAERETWG